MQRYRRVLEQAGYQVDDDPPDQDVLLVPRQPTRAGPPRPGRGLLAVAVVCAVAATVALVASWAADGAVRLAGGVGSAVLGVLAVFLAALSHRRWAHLV